MLRIDQEAKIPHIRYAHYIQSGTSSFHIFQYDHPEAIPEDLGHALASRMQSQLGGHYQDRKLIVFNRLDGLYQFRFFQINALGRCEYVKECANAAAALTECLVYMGLETDSVRLINVNSIQWLLVRRGRASGEWLVRFDYSLQPIKEAKPASQLIHIHDQVVPYWFAQAANEYIFIEGNDAVFKSNPRAFTLDALALIASKHGDQCHHKKVLLFCRESSTPTQLHCLAYYQGDFHRSIPGSGVMLLCRQLCVTDDWLDSCCRFEIIHPSGAAEVTVVFDNSLGLARVSGTEFLTTAVVKRPFSYAHRA